MAQWYLSAQNDNLLCTDILCPYLYGKNEFVRDENGNGIHDSRNENTKNFPNEMTLNSIYHGVWSQQTFSRYYDLLVNVIRAWLHEATRFRLFIWHFGYFRFVFLLENQFTF